MAISEWDKATEKAEATAGLLDGGHQQKKQTEHQDNPNATEKDTKAVAVKGECGWSLERLQWEST